MFKLKEKIIIFSLLLLLIPSVSAISNVQHSVDGNKVTITYQGTPPFLINIRPDTNIGQSGGYLWAKTSSTSFTYDMSFAINPSKKFYYGIKDKSWSETNSFDLVASKLKTAQILDIPLPKNSKCFWQKEEYANLPECAKFYKNQRELVCPKFYNPVYDSNGVFYPSACWAEQLGVTNYRYGYSNQMLQFINDLWYTPKIGINYAYQVPKPNIEFSYVGSGLQGLKNGVFLRSTLWKNKTDFLVLDFNIDIDQVAQNSISFYSQNTLIPVYGTTPKTLLVFVLFDDAYPEQVLLDWTKKYETFMNDYIKKKQRTPNPIQYNITPVVINPPQGVEKPSTAHLYFSDEEIQKMYNAAVAKIGQSKFQILVISPVFLNGFGGYYTYWNNMELIEAPLAPIEPYSGTDKQKGLNSLASFQRMFITISHEVLHAVGLSGDHIPMGYGTMYLDSVGQNVDTVTGKERIGPEPCDFFGTSQDYYAIKLPNNLKIFVGQEPSWLYKKESSTGPCLSGLEQNEYLKDYDKDGEYEIMYKNNLIGVELQRTLGWVDIDDDGIAEIIDSTPYGDYKEHTGFIQSDLCSPPCTKSNNMCTCPSDYAPPIAVPSAFEPIKEVTIGNCKFEEIRLENGETGLAPLECIEFNQDVVNLYQGVKYNWIKIQKDYGVVLIPRLTY